MENHTQNSLADDFAAALDWWRGAGVDCDFLDEAQGWLEEPQAKRQAVAAAASPAKDDTKAPPPPAIANEDLPTELDAFVEWWCDPQSPVPAGPGPRIAPRGETGALVMMLVPMPEPQDADALMQGPQGRMLANIAKAIGIAPEAIYVGSALPTHMPLPDWNGLASSGLGAAVAHHVSLAKPERVIVFGNKLPALLGHEYGAPPESFNQIAGIPALTTFAPERLLDHPRQRARLWQRLLEWKALA